MTELIPGAIISRNGTRAVALDELDEEWFKVTDHASHYVGCVLRLQPRADPCFGKIQASHFFRTMWDQPNQTVRWPENFAKAFPELALIGLGEFLDIAEVPPQPADGTYAITAHVGSDIFDVLRREADSDEALLRYVTAKIYWSWCFKFDRAIFGRADAARLGVQVDDLSKAAFRYVDTLWDQLTEESFRARPALVGHFEEQLRTTTIPARPPPEYDVALSFAGEQRLYVQEVATILRDSGITVFYDDFEDLWGQDLTIRLEEVYRRQARYVVVFVSQEYVAKAWPNLERQHALAGRIERMDDSVLPVRFDGTELPGLPASVGYLDASAMSAADLAERVRKKVGNPG